MKIETIKQAQEIATNLFNKDACINGVTVEMVFGEVFITKSLDVFLKEDAIKKGLFN